MLYFLAPTRSTGCYSVAICPIHCAFFHLLHLKSVFQTYSCGTFRTYFIRQEEVITFVLFCVKCKSGRLCFLSQIEGTTRLTQTRHGSTAHPVYLSPLSVSERLSLFKTCQNQSENFTSEQLFISHWIKIVKV